MYVWMYILKMYCNQRDVFSPSSFFMLMRRKKTTKNQYSAKSLSVWNCLNKKDFFNLYFNGYNVEKFFKTWIIRWHHFTIFHAYHIFILTMKICNQLWKVKLFSRQRKCLDLKCTHRRSCNYTFKKGNTFT